MADLPVGGGGGAGGAGWARIADVTPQDIDESVADKVYQDVANTVLQSCRASTLELTFAVRSSYPKVSIEGTDAELTLSPDGGHYAGNVDVTLLVGGAVSVVVTTPDDDPGAFDTVDITYDPPPAITTVEFTGGYPGAQTELKEDDTFSVSVQADKNFDQVWILDYEACKETITGVAVGTSAIVSGIIDDSGDTATLRPARVRVRDAATGAWSAAADTDAGGSVDGTNVVNCNNLRPSIAFGSIDYPLTQAALKNVESATVNHTVSDFDTVSYTDPTTAELSIANPATYESAKSTTRSGGTYNVATNNFQISANRAANNATTAAATVVAIANVAPVITVTTPAARLRSGGNNGTSAQNYTIELQSDQQLLVTPTLSADTGGNRGTFVGSWSGGPTTWTRTLQVDETTPDEKGTFAWSGLVATGLAGLVQNSVGVGANYTLGGFVARNLTFAAFATTTQIGTSVEDFSKLTAGIFTATNQAAVKQSIGTSPPVVNGYTIAATGANPTSLIWLDTAAAGSNSGGTAQITDVEETA